ncbi:hypothetical protein DFH05DRAFT_1456594 [Lentinula detonsa]|uniref:Uncharacterized protein n=1 Tax=Lentinula detonsa TaxID=2804962 RepID=A0A9W8P7H2_9AGAR|nr:hypothetical protein DFH05DRAFT_1456594 [Lentinula detonsa]KAJ3982302.1 hypothetical protein F5890DRAFT_1476269 [Lentinula detonsa]
MKFLASISFFLVIMAANINVDAIALDAKLACGVPWNIGHEEGTPCKFWGKDDSGTHVHDGTCKKRDGFHLIHKLECNTTSVDLILRKAKYMLLERCFAPGLLGFWRKMFANTLIETSIAAEAAKRVHRHPTSRRSVLGSVEESLFCPHQPTLEWCRGDGMDPMERDQIRLCNAAAAKSWDVLSTAFLQVVVNFSSLNRAM